MIDRRTWSSWLQGPVAATRDEDDYPGRRLGLPEAGPGSIARFGRRAAALCLDWAVALIAVRGIVGDSDAALQWVTLGLFAVMQTALVGTLGAGLGHLALRMRVVRTDGGPAGPLRAAARAVLLVLAVPPLVWDRDQRGLHDKLAGTVLCRV